MRPIEKLIAIFAAAASASIHLRLYMSLSLDGSAAKQIMEQLMLEMFVVSIPFGLLSSLLTKNEGQSQVVGQTKRTEISYKGKSGMINALADVSRGLAIGGVIWAVVGLACLGIAFARVAT